MRCLCMHGRAGASERVLALHQHAQYQCGVPRPHGHADCFSKQLLAVALTETTVTSQIR